MPVTLICPNCDARLTAPDTVLGKKVKCKKCDEPFVAKRAAAVDDEDDRPAKPAAKSRREDDGTSPPRRASKARRPADDEDAADADDEQPRPKAKKKGKKKKQGSPALLYVLLGIGALLLLGGGAAGVYFGFIHEPNTTTEPSGTAGDAPKGPGGKGAGGGAAAGWVEIHEPDGKYRVKFPVQPKSANQEAKLPQGVVKVKAHAAALPASQEAFISLHEAKPAGASVDEVFAQQLESLKTMAPGATVGEAQAITYQGHEGREFRLTMPGQQAPILARMIVAGDRVIALMVTAPNVSADLPRVKTFFESLKIE